MRFATMTEDGKILLPEELAGKLKSSQRFAVVEDGERIILNPIRIPHADEIAKRVKGLSPPTLEEISEEVHQYRRANFQPLSPGEDLLYRRHHRSN